MIHMSIFANQNLFHIFRKTLNLVDYRLVDHSERVAYIIMKMMQIQGDYSDAETAAAIMLAILHDIGAYKTEEINSLSSIAELIHFEIQEVTEHCAYGYLFLHNLLPMDCYQDVILYHHIRYDKLVRSDCENKDMASKFFIADRFDLLTALQKSTAAEKSFRDYSGSVFHPQNVELLFETEDACNLKEMLQSDDYLSELVDYFDGIQMSEERLIDFVKLLPYAIDFRSPFTVNHTIMTVGISIGLAEQLAFSEDEKKKLYLGSILHDLGKIATPLSILEKPGRLTPYEFSVMQDHVRITQKILENSIDDEIVQIAIRHHEKLDGSGYPYGLKAKDLTISQRILAVADMASALLGKRSYKEAMPRDLVCRILQDEADRNKISAEVVSVFQKNYDAVLGRANEISRKPLEKYQRIIADYPVYLKRLNTL